MSATEQMRAMLDSFMGTRRDGSDSKRQHLNFTDSRVCRAFLLDCCPHDIFSSTKLELGECSKVHDPALRADYLIANKSEDYMYEVSALERLQAFVNDADRKTDYLKRKLAETQKEFTEEETNKLNRVHELTEKLGEKLAQIDKAEADGEPQEVKQKLIHESERIKRERVNAEAEYKLVSRPASSHQHQNLKVCDVCSAYLGINDNDSRLADHFGGKLHLGFITVREKLEELKKIVADKRGSVPRDYDRERGKSRDYDRGYRSRDYDRDRYRDRDRERERERERDRDRYPRDSRYHDRDMYRERERDRSRSSEYYDNSRGSSSRYYSSRDYYRNDRDSRPRDRYRDDRVYDRHDSGSRSGRQGRSGSALLNERIDGREQEGEIEYQKRLREWERRESEKLRKYAIREAEERDKLRLEEQESKKLKEFLEDYKDDRDDIRYYRGSALARRLADRRKEIEIDEADRQKEKIELEMLSKYAAAKSSPEPIKCANDAPDDTPRDDPIDSPEVASNHTNHNQETTTTSTTTTTTISNHIVPTTTIPTTLAQDQSQNKPTEKPEGSSSEDKKKQVEELIRRIPTDKDELFARKLDWTLLDQNLMEKRIRPWVSRKIVEYMGEQEVDLINFVCTQLNAHVEGNAMLRELAVLLDDEAEKFVVHMWRLLIFELEAKKLGLRK